MALAPQSAGRYTRSEPYDGTLVPTKCTDRAVSPELSKSGVDASVGIKGARLTVTPRGTTYITVGRNGFYYRETISSGRGTPYAPAPLALPPSTCPQDEIPTADALTLVDSSSETLVARLNERAQMFNPAALLYCASAVLFLIGIMSLPEDTPKRPAFRMLGADTYAVLVAHYGYPNLVLANSPLGMVPVRTAIYSSANAGAVFVPNTCTALYEDVTRVLRDESRQPSLAKQERKKLRKCAAPLDAPWAAVGYVAPESKVEISLDDAKRRLNAIRTQESSPPLIQSEQPTGTNQMPSSKRGTNKRIAVKQTWPAPEELVRKFRSEEQHAESARNFRDYSPYAFILASVLCVGLGIVVHRRNTAKRTTRLFYELSESEEKKYSIVQQAMANLSRSHQVWRIRTDSPTSDWKHNAGASSLVRRVSSTAGFSSPPRVETNVKAASINVGDAWLYFLPDLVLYWDHGTYGSIAYGDFAVDQGSTRFIEDGNAPADATLVGKTWRYVNKNGGPDRRFNDNAQLPVLQYGTLTFQSSLGLNIRLQTSNLGASESFANCWRQLRTGTAGVHSQSTADGRHEVLSGPEAQARKVLGVSGTASFDEIAAEYRRLAPMYHPDKVAGLAPEFQVIAETRMRELNTAYEVLKQRQK